MKLSVISYNLLAACHIQPERYPDSPAEALDSGWRNACLVEQIAALDADLVCLQEATPDCFALLSSRLGFQRYQGFLDLRSCSVAEGCAFFAKTGIARVQGRSRLDFGNPPEIGGASRRLAQLLNLEAGGRRFVVANTHLQWDFRDKPASCHRGVEQARQLVEVIDLAVGRTGDAIVCGDLNARHDSAVCHVFFEAGYIAVRPEGPDQPTCRANGNLSEIDFVLCRGFPTAIPCARYVLDERNPMPGHEYPSDHIPVGAII
jgi:endonuclease/exonuclease/phosphatase family metal-dependent hydrolase